MEALTSWVVRRAPWIVAVAVLLSLGGGWYSYQLYRNLRPDLEELLPTSSRSVRDLNEVTRRFAAVDNLAILVFSKHVRESRRFVDDLAHELERAPPDTIARVEYRINREIQFFRTRRALYLDVPDLIKIRKYIHDRVDYETSLYNPLNIFSGVDIPEPHLNLLDLRQKYDSRVSMYTRFPDGYFATPDETKRAILAYLPGKLSGIENVHRIKAYVDQAIARLDPGRYAKDIEIHFSGGVQNMLEEQQDLIADLELSTVVVTLLVTLAMLAFFRDVRATASLVIALFMATAWTFGIAYFAVGYLNANSAFLGSIVIGNGINFGIIHLARYLEERRRAAPRVQAFRTAAARTAGATIVAALGAGLSYGSLMLTRFRGFSQFGVIGFIGMILCWISAYTVQPALLALLNRDRSAANARNGARFHVKRYTFSGRVAALVGRFPRFIGITSLLLAGVSIVLISRVNGSILEADMTKVRSHRSMETGSGYYNRYIDEIFQRYLTPMVILPRKLEDVQPIASRLRVIKKREGASSLIANVQTLEDFLPKNQARKIAILKEIRDALPPKLIRRLSPRDRRQVRELLNPAVFRPVRASDLPPMVLNNFTEKDGSLGKLILVEPVLGGRTRERLPLIHFVQDLRAAADSIEPDTAVAGALPVSADILESIAEDGPRATLFAFFAVTALVVILFRRIGTVISVLSALLLGVAWLGGIVMAEGIRINFLNFVALPITFGIGVDYGVNIFQRFREGHEESIVRVVRETGGAVALCSLTTIIGYSSLLLAQNGAFVSFGLLAVLGELTCLPAALISLPAFLALRERRRPRQPARPAAAEKPAKRAA